MHLVYHVPQCRTASAARCQRFRRRLWGLLRQQSCVPVAGKGVVVEREAITKYAAAVDTASAAASVVADPMIQSKSAPFELINKNVYKYTLNSATDLIVVVLLNMHFKFDSPLFCCRFQVE